METVDITETKTRTNTRQTEQKKERPLPPWRYFWSLITFKPWLFSVNLFFIIALLIMMRINAFITLIICVPMMLIVGTVRIAGQLLKQRRSAARDATGDVT